MAPIKIGIVGLGHWGPNHVRIFSSLDDSQVVHVCDSNPGRVKAIAKNFPNIRNSTKLEDLLSDPEVSAVVVSTPTSTHYEVVKSCLLKGKHVLCEKPLTMTATESKELMEIAAKKKKVLMVGHVFVFNSGIRQLKKYIEEGVLGRLYYLCSTRTNLGPIREDVNAIWDLASHDFSIFNFLLGSSPKEVTAKGEIYLQKNLEDIAFISMSYPGKVLANAHVSWLDPRKIREIVVVGDRKMAVWNDLSLTEPIRLYDKWVIEEPYYEDYGEFHLIPKEGDITIPKIKMVEPLKAQGEHFLECIKRGRQAITDGRNGLNVVKVLEAVQESIKGQGFPVKV